MTRAWPIVFLPTHALTGQPTYASDLNDKAENPLPRNCDTFLSDLALGTRNSALTAYTTAELGQKLTMARKVRFSDYVQESLDLGTYLSEVRPLHLLQAPEMPISFQVQTAISNGLIGYGLPIELSEIRELFEQGSIMISREHRDAIRILTKSHLNQVPSHRVLDANRVMVIISPRFFDETMAHVYLSRPDESFDFDDVATSGTQNLTISQVVRESQKRFYLEDTGRLRPNKPLLSLPIWAVQGLVGTDRIRDRIRESLPSIPKELFSSAVTETILQPNLLRRRIRIFEPVHATARIGFQNPPLKIWVPTQDELIQAKSIAFWLILNGSDFRITLKNQHVIQGRLLETLVPSNTLGKIKFRIKDADHWVETVDFDEISQIALINYRPNGPGQGKIAIRYKSLSDSSFLAYLRSKTPDLLRPIRLVP